MCNAYKLDTSPAKIGEAVRLQLGQLSFKPPANFRLAQAHGQHIAFRLVVGK